MSKKAIPNSQIQLFNLIDILFTGIILDSFLEDYTKSILKLVTSSQAIVHLDSVPLLG